jgi:protein tyrosine/serine phosphatase
VTAVERRLPWDNLLNARDLGGLPMPGGWTRFRALARSDGPRRLTAEGRAALLAYGVNTIVDVRSPRELAALPSPFAGHPAYRSLPFFDDAGQAASTRHDTAAENYLEWLATQPARIAAILHGIAGAPPGCVLVHCVAGKDRTGVVIALVLAAAGIDREAIADDFAQSVSWNDGVRDENEVATTPDESQRVRERWIYYPRRENMVELLAEIDRRHGGVDRYLGAIGVGPAVRERLRDRLG